MRPIYLFFANTFFGRYRLIKPNDSMNSLLQFCSTGDYAGRDYLIASGAPGEPVAPAIGVGEYM
jgi:hypothetical protein